MIEVSSLAKTVLHETLRSCGVLPLNGLRLSQGEEGFILALDYPGPKDRIIEDREEMVLIVDRELESEIGDAFIDVREIDDRAELVIARRA